MRQVLTVETSNGVRYKVRFRLGTTQSSETFTRESDALMFRDLLGNGRGERVQEALKWLEARKATEATTVVVFGEWFDTYIEQLTGVSDRTRNDYRSMHRRYLSHLDGTPLPMLTRTHVTRLVNDLDRAGRAPKTIRQTVHLLSTCLQLAITEGHMTENPCRKVRLPTQSIDAVEARFLSAEEADMLITAVPAQYRPLVTFLLGTGLRWSEATAIETRHVNLTAGTVRVEQAWKRTPGGFVIGSPKSRKAKRTVNAAVIALLAVKPLLGKPRDLVFTTVSGGPVRHANFFNNVWKPACARAGFDPAPRLHDLRHTHASWLLSEGIGIEAVQDQLGHESMETTRKVYAHLMPAVGVAVGKAASAALERALVSQATAEVLPLPLPQVVEPDLDHAQADAKL